MTQIVLRDHPRLRGEYNDWNTDKATEQGSPPLARGIPLYLSDEDKEMGITPACAGNTTMEATLQLGIRDHPRLRGEYLVSHGFSGSGKGSPPLARGILAVINTDKFGVRITPACAGNTWCRKGKRRSIRDHPRLRGEYTKKIPYLQPFPDLHL